MKTINCVPKVGSMIIIGVPRVPKDLFPVYLTDENALFEKQSHYPLILIENSNLPFPQISEGPRLQKERHPYGLSSNQLTHIQDGEVKRSSYRTHMIAVADYL